MKTPFLRIYDFWNAIEPAKRETALKMLINDLAELVPPEALELAIESIERTTAEMATIGGAQ